MSGFPGIVFATLWLAVLIALCGWTIWGDLAERTFATPISSLFRALLLVRPEDEKRLWIRYQKIIASIALPFGAIVYVMILMQIIRGEK